MSYFRSGSQSAFRSRMHRKRQIWAIPRRTTVASFRGEFFFTFPTPRWAWLRGWRTALLLAPLLLLLLWLLGGAAVGQERQSELTLPLAKPQAGPPTHIEPSWEAGATSEGGFLAVEGVLSDPKTTKEPPRPLETLASDEKEDIEIDEEEDEPNVGPREVTNETKESSSNISKASLESNYEMKPNQNADEVRRPKVKSDVMAARRDNNNTDYASVMSYNSHFSPHTTRDLYLPGYTVENKEACSKEETRVLVAILVISAPEHSSQRKAIRETWGSPKDGVIFSFVVGTSTGETKVALETEARREGDLIISRVEDHYENLGLKTISALDWILQMCPEAEFVLKVDDDMFVQVDRLLELIEDLMKEDPLQKLILGNISKGWKPVRNPKSKYFITEAQYAEEKYPDFATGPSYLVSKAAVEPLVETALGQLYIHLEDVFLTGVVAEKLGVERRNNEQFKNNAVRVPARFMGCTLLHTITIHKVGAEEQAEMHALASSPVCGKGEKRPRVLSRSDWKKALVKMRKGDEKYFKAIAENNKV